MALGKMYDISNAQISRLRGTTSTVALSEEDLNPWYYCKICQHCAREPVCCKKGDVFCKECILNYIIMHKNKKYSVVEEDPNMKNQINKFLDLQRIVPQAGNEIQIQPKANIKKKTKKKLNEKIDVLCPQCNKKIKYQKLIPLIITFDNEIPICSSCQRQITGNSRGMRISCSHVICDKCATGIAKETKSCPVCHKEINFEKTILLNKTVIEMKNANGKILVQRNGILDLFA